MEYSFQNKQQAQDKSGKSFQLDTGRKNEEEIVEEQSIGEMESMIQVLQFHSFQSSLDQVVFNSEALGLTANSRQLSLAFSFACSQDEQEKKKKKNSEKGSEELKYLIQLGNRGIKFLQVSIDQKTNKLCLTYRRSLDFEYIYSQIKIKPIEYYHIQVTYGLHMAGDRESYFCSLFINGVLQSQVLISEQIVVPHKYQIFIGSESADELFTGVISDLIIGNQELRIEVLQQIWEKKKCKAKKEQQLHNQSNNSNESLKELAKIPQILDIIKEIQRNHQKEKENSLMMTQIKHQVPNEILEKHNPSPSDEYLDQLMSEKQSMMSLKKDHSIENFKNYLQRYPLLNDAMRKMSLNYKWIFLTLFAMSPSIEEGIGQKIPFFCLHSLIASGVILASQQPALHIIETTRFHRVLSYAQILIAKDQLEILAEKAGCLKTYTHEQTLEGNLKQKLKILSIKYDKFMQIARDCSLSAEELANVKQLTKINPHQEEEDIENEKKEWNSVQNEFMYDNQKRMFNYSSIKHLQRVLKIKQVPNAIKESELFQIVGMYLILPPFKPINDINYYNTFVQKLFEFRYNQSIQNLFKSICPGKLTQCSLSIFTAFLTGKLQLSTSPSIEEIFNMICFQNNNSFGNEEFSCFINNWCLGSIYQHKVSLLLIYIDPYMNEFFEISSQQQLLMKQQQQQLLLLQQQQQLPQQQSHLLQIPSQQTKISPPNLIQTQNLAGQNKQLFQFQVIVEPNETVQGITGKEEDGFIEIYSLKIITNKRKIQLIPLKDQKQSPNQIFQDSKTAKLNPQRQNTFSYSPWENKSTKVTNTNVSQASHSFFVDTIEENNFINNNNNNNEEVAPEKLATMRRRKKSQTMIVGKQQATEEEEENTNMILPIPSNQSVRINKKRESDNTIISESEQNKGYLDNHLKEQDLQSASDRNIRLQQESMHSNLLDQADNLILYFDPAEKRKVQGFEILINQDHNYPLKYSEDKEQSQKFIYKFSSLKLFSCQNNIQTPSTTRTSSPTPIQQAKQNINSQYSSEVFDSSNRINTQAPSFQDDASSSITPTQAQSIIPLSLTEANTAVQTPQITQRPPKLEDYPILCNSWNQGKFQVIINHCSKCATHSMTTQHDETDFCEKFNELGLLLSSTFPNIEIIGNYEKPASLEAFEVYIRGVGPPELRDNQGRLWLFKKNELTRLFLAYFQQRVLKIFDGLILLSLSYGDSIGLEKLQEGYIAKYNSLLPQISPDYHEYPCVVPQRQKILDQEKKQESEIPIGTTMMCKNWGCGKLYEYSNDITDNKSCRYHPKQFDFGSMHGLWPESWACCRGEWGSKGCTDGRHSGQPEKKFQRLCINHGEINPESKHPDSACGQYFIESEGKPCRYHRGYYKVESKDIGYWTCCTDGTFSAEGCNEDNHEAVSWPDERARIYFVVKAIRNPGIDKQNLPQTFDKTSLQSTIYRVTEQYKPYMTRKTQLQQERKANENEIRVCINWGCEEKSMRFKEIDNINDQKRHIKNCTYHPGYFDFGNVSKPGGGIISIHQQLTNSSSYQINANVIRPHWTCCRSEWKAIGCKLTYHWGKYIFVLSNHFIDLQKGPVESTMAELKHGRWPDVNAMKYFKKQASQNFKKNLGELVLDEETARHYWYQFSLGKEQIPIENLGELCDKFKLSLMALSEDLSYHFKYFDVLRGIAQKTLNNGSGMVDREKFTEWWLQPLDKYPIKY